MEKLGCSCSFPDKYKGESGIWYCGECGGIANRREDRNPEEIALNSHLIGSVGIQCDKCKHIDFNYITAAGSLIDTLDKLSSYRTIYCKICHHPLHITDKERQMMKNE